MAQTNKSIKANTKAKAKEMKMRAKGTATAITKSRGGPKRSVVGDQKAAQDRANATRGTLTALNKRNPTGPVANRESINANGMPKEKDC